MNEPIDFPLNFDRYMEMGQLALADGLLDEALLNFENAYNLQEDFQANRSLVSVLMARSEFFEAKKIADEMKADYLGDAENFLLYLTLLAGTQFFIQGRKLVRHSDFSDDVKESCLAELEQGEHFFRKFQRRELVERQALALELSCASFYQQGKQLRALERLPQTEYIEIAKKLIDEADLPLLLNNGLIETLVELGCQVTVDSQTINGRQTINLAELMPIDQQKSYLACLKQLQLQLENNDSELSQSLREELRLQFILLYPLGDQLINDPGTWIELFLASYFDNELKEDHEMAYLDLQRRLRQELASLVI